MRMAIHTPSIPIFFYERSGGVKRIATLGAEEVTSMPFRTARDDDLTLDGRLAALAAW
jgi:hypothetical protein